MRYLKKLSACIAMLLMLVGILMPANQIEAIEREKPRLIVSQYSLTNNAIAPGEESELVFKIKNMSKTHPAYNVLVSVTSDSLTAYPKYSTSNQTFVEVIQPGSEASISMTVVGSMSLSVQSVDFKVNLLYQDVNGEQVSNDSILQLPVGVENVLAITKCLVPETAAINTRTRINASVKNNGSEELSNVQMIVQVDGNEQPAIDVGTMSGKAEGFRDTYVEFETTGKHTVSLRFTYYDATGQAFETSSKSYEVNVIENVDDLGDNNASHADQNQNNGVIYGIQIWQICLAAGVFLIIIIIMIVLRKDKN